MLRYLPRAVVAALVGAIAGAAALVAGFKAHPDLTFEMDRDLPARVTSGFYPVEFSGDQTFAWTSELAQINVPGVNRQTPWVCHVRFRGGRSADLKQPDVTLAIDSRPSATRTSTNDFQDLDITAPA